MKAVAPKAIRSTETRQFNGGGCPTEWLLDKAYPEYVVPKVFYFTGTGGHLLIEYDLMGIPLDLAWDEIMAAPEWQHKEWIETKNNTRESAIETIGKVYQAWRSKYDALVAPDVAEYKTEVLLEAETPNGTKISTTADFVYANKKDKVGVMDWKLGTSKSGQDMQLHVYWYCMRQMGLVSKRQKMIADFFYVNYENPIEPVRAEAYIGDEAVEAYVDNAEQQRRNGPYLPNPTWFSCNYCSHKDRCPIYQGADAWEAIAKIEVTFE